MQTIFWILAIFAGLTTLAFVGASLIVWTVTVLTVLVLFTIFGDASVLLLLLLWGLAFIVFFPLNIEQFRKDKITSKILKLYRKLQPKMSKTESEALAAGTVDWDGELFSGSPNWEKLLAYPKPTLTEEEQAFLDGPVEELARMINNWDITHNRADLPPEMWKFIKEKGFFGLIIPKDYKGKGFSALAHSAVLMKLASKSSTVCSTIAVPNSLGPAELLLHYGTEQQKDYYLPRLATGEEVPCFALTGPNAGSDASAMPDTGIVCHHQLNGEKTLGIRLNWNKRYITLAPIATVLGLAFKLYDPDHLLGEETNLGITCALIPTNTQGVTIGRRHFPLNIVFQNGPTQGKDVFIPIDFIIGGKEMAGHGWRMLVECLSAGRGITLPSNATGGAKAGLAATSAYARIRKQFHLPIGHFEGVQEALARIAGFTYIMDSARSLTVGFVDQGQKPSVLTAISKYHITELGRKVANDAMDIHGGKGICLGPKNYLGRGYQSVPIMITVEGANILTRSMIIFGQGAVRCHPYVLKEIEAAQEPDDKIALDRFDKVLFDHLSFTIQNKARAFVLGLTSGRLSKAPAKSTQRYYQQLARFSAAFAYLTDVTMLVLGGELKFREKTSARLGDVLSMLYLGSAVLKRFNDDDSPAEDMPIVHWSMQYILYQIQTALDGVLQNFPKRYLAIAMRLVIFPWGRRLKMPSDKMDKRVVDLVLEPSETRSRMIKGADFAAELDNPIGLMEKTLEKIIAITPLEKKLMAAIKEGKIKAHTIEEQVNEAVAHEILTQKEAEQYLEAEKEREAVIAVDDFAPEDLMHGGLNES